MTPLPQWSWWTAGLGSLDWHTISWPLEDDTTGPHTRVVFHTARHPDGTILISRWSMEGWEPVGLNGRVELVHEHEPMGDPPPDMLHHLAYVLRRVPAPVQEDDTTCPF